MEMQIQKMYFAYYHPKPMINICLFSFLQSFQKIGLVLDKNAAKHQTIK